MNRFNEYLRNKLSIYLLLTFLVIRSSRTFTIMLIYRGWWAFDFWNSSKNLSVNSSTHLWSFEPDRNEQTSHNYYYFDEIVEHRVMYYN